MKVLVIGSGGREHALCWAISTSPLLTKLWCAPGNLGIAEVAECVPIHALAVRDLVNFANQNQVDLVVVGPEAPLVEDGISDALAVFNIPCCGPSKEAAQLEGSKYFTKQLCTKMSIPTGDWWSFTESTEALAFLENTNYPKVIKEDGLAAGKGVFIVENIEKAQETVDLLMVQHTCKRIVIEEFLDGTEVSFFALCNGTTAIPLGTAQDYKRAWIGGPNTGGMGAISPSPIMTPELHAKIWLNIIFPTIRAIRFKGMLFAGIMVTKDGPKLLEFNVRFGDPECQALMMRLKCDILPSLYAAATGRDMAPVKYTDKTSVAVVMAAPGYPATPQTGSLIRLPETRLPGARIFQSGTKLVDGQMVAAGGRVLTVAALGNNAINARRTSYQTISQIDWPEGWCRNDIGELHES